jgi:hypothetical protein
MSKTKEETVQQWRESLAESARTAVEALAAITPIDKPAPSTDEASEILGHAILKIRELVRPEPKTVAFLEEAAWYRMKGAEKPAGEYHTPKDALDFVMANPPLDIPPAAEPIDPNAPKMVQGHAHVWAKGPDSVGNSHRGDVVHSWVFTDGAGVHVCAKQLFEDGEYKACWNVTGTIDCERAFFGTVFAARDRMRVIAKFIRNGLLAARLRRKHKAANKKARSVCGDSVAAPHPEPLSPEEELADTIKRQREEVQA